MNTKILLMKYITTRTLEYACLIKKSYKFTISKVITLIITEITVKKTFY